MEITRVLAALITLLVCLQAMASTAPQGTTFGSTPILLETYPTPTPRISALFEVEVSIDGGATWRTTNAAQHTRESMAENYYGNQNIHLGVYPWVHWSKFGISSKALVRVTKKSPRWAGDYSQITDVRFEPERYGIAPITVNGNQFTFPIASGQYVCIYPRFDNTNYTGIDSLLVFACPPAPPKPASIPSDMLYYGAGVHYLGAIRTHAQYQTSIDPLVVSPNIRTIYLDAGAYVVGNFDLRNTTGPVEIIGPGILSGEGTTWEYLKSLAWPAQSAYAMITAHPVPTVPPTWNPWVHNLHVNGPTIIQSPNFNLWAGEMTGRVTIENTQVISPWTYNTDGFLTSNTSSASINNCFIFNNDNMFSGEDSHSGSLIVKDCVLAGRTAILLGYGSWDSSRAANARFSGIDFCNLLKLNTAAPIYCGVASPPSGALSVVDRQYYSDIHVAPVSKLFHIEIKLVHHDPSWKADGKINGIYFTNISGSQSGLSIIETPSTPITGSLGPIYFTNVVIGGVKLTSSNWGSYIQVVGATQPTLVFN